MNRGKLLVWMVLGATLFGCSGGGGGGGGGSAGPGPSSKVVTSQDGNASVSIPAGTEPSGLVITVVPAVNSPAGNKGSAYEFGPDGTNFTKQVTIKITFDPNNLGGASPSSLKLAKVINNSWEVVPGSTVNTASHFVSGNTTSFSVYGVVEVPEPSTTTSTTSTTPTTTTTAASTTTTSTTTAPTTTTTTTIPAPDTIKEADAELNAWYWMDHLTFFNYAYDPPYTDIKHLFGFFDWIYDPDTNLLIGGVNTGPQGEPCMNAGGTIAWEVTVDTQNPLIFIYEETVTNCQEILPSGNTLTRNGYTRAETQLSGFVDPYHELNYTFEQRGLFTGEPYTEEEKDGGGNVVSSWVVDLTMTGIYSAKNTNRPYPGAGEIRFDLTLDGYEILNGVDSIYTGLNDKGYYKWGSRGQEEVDDTLTGGFLFDSTGLPENIVFTNFHYNDNINFLRTPSGDKWIYSYAFDGRFDYTGTFLCPDWNGVFDFDTSVSGKPITWDLSVSDVEPVSGKEVIMEIQDGTPLRDVVLQVNGLNSVQASSVDEDWVKNFTSWNDIYTVCQ